MGDKPVYPEEGPASEIHIKGFWLDATEVSVGQFARFVEATGYVTIAERPVDPAIVQEIDLTGNPEAADFLLPGGAVFDPRPGVAARNLNWWRYVPGAHWRRPQGPDRPPARPDEPVTQLAIEDAKAYAEWVGGRLPTEAEWEYAAVRGGARTSTPRPEAANTWQGLFPLANSGDDRFKGVAPVGCYPADASGLHDLIGNVWEWTSDNYGPLNRQDRDKPIMSGAADKAGVMTYVIKGGSFLCAANYCYRFRAAARQAQEAGLGTNHIGVRVAYDKEPTSFKKEDAPIFRP